MKTHKLKCVGPVIGDHGKLDCHIPYECEKEIDFIGSFYNIRNHVLIFYINNFEGDEKLKSYFKIR